MTLPPFKLGRQNCDDYSEELFTCKELSIDPPLGQLMLLRTYAFMMLLVQEWMVDSYAHIESQRLQYLKRAQKQFCTDKYKLYIASYRCKSQGRQHWQTICFAFPFIGSHWNMKQLYQVCFSGTLDLLHDYLMCCSCV